MKRLRAYCKENLRGVTIHKTNDPGIYVLIDETGKEVREEVMDEEGISLIPLQGTEDELIEKLRNCQIDYEEKE